MALRPILQPVLRPPHLRALGSRIGRGGAGGGGATVYPAKTGAYSQNFNAQTNGTSLRNLAGWAAYSSVGSTASSRDCYTVSSGQITSNGDFGTQPVGTFVIGYDIGSADHIFRTTLTAAATVGAQITLVIAATDETNAICLHAAVSSTGTLGTIFIDKKDATGTITLWTGGGINSAIGRAVAVGDVIELRIIGRLVYLYINDIQMTTAGGVNIDNTRVFTKGTRVGFGTFNVFGANFDNVYAAPLGALIEHSASSMAWANLANDGTSNVAGSFPIFWPGKIGQGRQIPLAFTYSGTVSDIDYRVVHYSTGAVVQDWQRVAAADRSLSSGSGTASVLVPMASTATNPALRIDIRAANDVDTGVCTPVTTVGLCVGEYGQSNSVFRDSGNGGTAAAAYTRNNAYFWSSRQGKTWQGGVTGASETAPGFMYAHTLAQITGIPCGFFVGGVGSQSIANLIASDSIYQNGNGATGVFYDDFVTEVTSKQCNANGYLAWVEWTQGESESEGAGTLAGSDVTAYRSNFDTLLSLLRGGRTASATTPVGVCIIGQNTADKGAASATANTNWSLIRQTLFGLTDKSNVVVSAGMMDLAHATSDSLHMSCDSYVELNRRGALSAAKALGYIAYDGRGPYITGATRSGATITLAVNLNGASSIAGTGLTNYEVSTDSFATTKTISSVAVSGSSIVITLAADPGAAVKVRSFYGYWPEKSSGAVNPQDITATRAIGTYVDGTHIPVEPIYTAITSN